MRDTMSHEHDIPHGHDSKAQYEHALVEHDSWFRHDPTEGHHQEAHGQTKPMVIIAFLFGTLALVIVVGLFAMQFLKAETRGIKRTVQERNVVYVKDYRESTARWEARLKGYEWIDANAGRVSVPITQAKQKVIAQYAKGAK